MTAFAAQLPALLIGLCTVVLLLCHAVFGWVPILDHANLAFHEAGHPLFGLLSERLSVYGGTVMQLVFPAACAWDFRRRDQPNGLHASLLWFAENLLNVARYIADARAQRLPLVGGVDPADAHDWTEILGRWGLLQHDTVLAWGVRLAAVALMAWTVRRAWRLAGGQHADGTLTR